MIPMRQAPCKVCDEPWPNVRVALAELNRGSRLPPYRAEVLCPECYKWARRVLETAARLAALRRGARPNLISLGLWREDDVPRYEDVAFHEPIQFCKCHPVSSGCCARGLPNAVLGTENVDAIDSLGFAWHVEPPCSVVGFARNRVVDGQPVRMAR